MDNYYNSLLVLNELLKIKTHSTGNVRNNAKGNPKPIIITKKLKRGEYIWYHNGQV